MQEFWLNPDLLVLTGSRLYGTNVETSDYDTRGFAVPSGEYLLGRKSWEQFEDKQKDTVIWSFPKFFHLLEKFSPNTSEILFAPKTHILKITDIGQLLLDNKYLFLSKEIIKPMQGFAFGEWKKAVDYFDQIRKLGAKRKEDIASFGYSIKNAYHAVRLLETCIELLQTGHIIFPRPNANFLRQIRNGEVEVEEIKEIYARLDKQVFIELENSPLQEKTNKDKIDKLYYQIIENKLKQFISNNF